MGTAASGAFIRGLWGDALIERHRQSVLEMQQSLAGQCGPIPAPMHVFCFGKENAELAEKVLGRPVSLLNPEPVVDFLGSGIRSPGVRGVGNYGSQMWRHKLEIIRQALLYYPQIVWLDWDVFAKGPVPKDFWDRLQAGPPLQCSLVQLKNAKAFWRAADRRKVCDGSFIYVRGQKTGERLCESYDSMPMIVDQELLALEIDRLLGTWKGVEHYAECGFQPYCHRSHQPVLEPEIELFATRRPVSSKARAREQKFQKAISIGNRRRRRASAKRILVYGMQSSGASWVTWTIAQDPETIAVIDLFNDNPAPGPEEFPEGRKVILKATLSLKHTLEEQIDRFKPDWVIMVMRDEPVVRSSLERKNYGKEIQTKLSKYRMLLRRPELFNEVIQYEKWRDAHREPLERSLADILAFACKESKWCREGRRRPKTWGTGNIHLED